MARRLSRPFAALGTEWLDRYRTNFFFRTECNVIALQVVFLIVILSIFIVILNYVQQGLAQAMLASINQILSPNPPPASEVLREFETSKVIISFWVFLVMTVVTGVFGYVLSRFTLFPARHALEAQKRFISNIAHELRTPLSILRTNIDITLMDEGLPKRTRQMLTSSIEELERISEIINNLLTLNNMVRVERMKFENVNLSAIVKDSVKKLSDLAKQKQIEITFRQSKSTAVWGNATALSQVTFNIIKNALMYTPDQGRVTVTVEPDAHRHVNFIVEDSGIGITKEELFHIFEPFYRTEYSRTRNGGGSGLGLSIVSEVVKLHSGKISLKSIPKYGTTVMVSLPRGRKNGVAAQPEEEADSGEITLDFLKNH